MGIFCQAELELRDITGEVVYTLQCYLEPDHGEGFHYHWPSGVRWQSDLDGDGLARGDGPHPPVPGVCRNVPAHSAAHGVRVGAGGG